MNQLIEIILILAVLSFPIILCWLYLNTLNKKNKKAIQKYLKSSSITYKNLNVWVKNFDVLRKKNKFNIDPYQTLYSFNYCDLILNEKNFMVVGKADFFSNYITLPPTIFQFKNENTAFITQTVEITDIQYVYNDLEIEFIDFNYLDKMIFVIKRPNTELKEKIKNWL